MKEKFEKFDFFLKQLNLKRVQNDFGGGKWLFVSIEGSEFIVKLQFTYSEEVLIEEFKGSIEYNKLVELITNIIQEIKNLEL